MTRRSTLQKLITTTALAATILGAFLIGHKAHGAVFTAIPQSDHANTYNVHLDGEIKLNDDVEFERVIKGLNGAKVVVVLNSPGGNVLAGLNIGAQVRNNKFSTQVPEKVTCVSMCSNIWLAGVTRYAADDSRIGFHSAGMYVGKKSDQHVARTEDGNAHVRKYYLALGLSNQTATLLLAANPNDITWMTADLADALGIEWKVYSASADASKAEWKKAMAAVADTPTGIASMFWPSSIPDVDLRPTDY